MTGTLYAGEKFFLPFIINQTDLLAGTPFQIVAPCDGYVEEVQSVVQVAVGTGGALTVEIGGVAVAGLSVVIADAAAAGDVDSDTPTAKSATRAFSKGDVIEVIPAAAFATSGAVNGNIICNTVDTDPAL